MLKKSSSNKRLPRLNSIENHSPLLDKSTNSISSQTDPMSTATKSTNTPNYVQQMLIEGQKMTDEQFEQFVRGKKVNLRVKSTGRSNSSILPCLKYSPEERIFRALEEEIRSSARGGTHPLPFLDEPLIFPD